MDIDAKGSEDSAKVDKQLRKGKPGMQIYRPGSGPLKKSGANMGGTLPEGCSDVRQGNDCDEKGKSAGKKPAQALYRVGQGLKGNGEGTAEVEKPKKRPEAPLYVPKGKVQEPVVKPVQPKTTQPKLPEEKENCIKEEVAKQNKGKCTNSHTPSEEANGKSRRRSNSGRRPTSPFVEKNIRSSSETRSPTARAPEHCARQASEPRSLPPAKNSRRDRRSVEPQERKTNSNTEKNSVNSRPPIARRTNRPHGPSAQMESLPPRLQRKLLGSHYQNPTARQTEVKDVSASSSDWDAVRSPRNMPKGLGKSVTKNVPASEVKRGHAFKPAAYDKQLSTGTEPAKSGKRQQVVPSSNSGNQSRCSSWSSEPDIEKKGRDLHSPADYPVTKIQDWSEEVESDENISQLSRVSSPSLENVNDAVQKDHRKGVRGERESKRRNRKRSNSHENVRARLLSSTKSPSKDQQATNRAATVSPTPKNSSGLPPSGKTDTGSVKGGLIYLPQPQLQTQQLSPRYPYNTPQNYQRFPFAHPSQSLPAIPSGQHFPPPYPAFSSHLDLPGARGFSASGPRHLFDPKNPHKPIVVSPGRQGTPYTRDGEVYGSEGSSPQYSMCGQPHVSLDDCQTSQSYNPGIPHPGFLPYADSGAYGPGGSHPQQFGGTGPPSWYDPYSESFRSARCNPHLLLDIRRADMQLYGHLHSGQVLQQWGVISELRQFLQKCLLNLLVIDLKFCEAEQVEQHLWKLAFYNVIEVLRKGMSEGAEMREQYRSNLISLIDEGTSYFENLLEVLQKTHKFEIDKYLDPLIVPPKGHSYVGLALVACQKVFICLGDLARYKEQANGTTNFGKARSWYLKANQVNPKNGRPYNQLAILAVYVRRKLDSVYYHMRSLMASNPFFTAKESLLSLFDENRKKYEQLEKKRFEERNERMKERDKIHHTNSDVTFVRPLKGLRKEVWIHSDGGRRVCRTTSAMEDSSEEEEVVLRKLTSVEVNKRFVTSYLQVQGKLFTKVGMETFSDVAVQMLREFRVLMQQSPVPFPANRLLQLLALNMFAIENTQLKDIRVEGGGYRSALQEHALAVSLEMFSLLLERCNALLKEQQSSNSPLLAKLLHHEDLQILLPAIKVFTDWLLCHSSVWNPPPSAGDYRIGPPGDVWSRLATLINLLEKIDLSSVELVDTEKEGYQAVRLPEDGVLSGFTPLMMYTQELLYTPSTTDMELAQGCVRLRKLLFFGTEFLCGVDPQVLKLLKREQSRSEYVSVVTSASSSPPGSSPVLEDRGDFYDERENSGDLEDGEHSDSGEHHPGAFGDEEGDLSSCDSTATPSSSNSNTVQAEIRNLIHRKEQLEKRHMTQQRQRQRHEQALLEENCILEMEVHPRTVVPDTNCFIDFLSHLQKLSRAGEYTLAVPVIVLNELDGLAKGSRTASTVADSHASKVAESAKAALHFLHEKPPNVRCVTSRGTFINSVVLTAEEDSSEASSNDDRILTTCLSLCSNKGQQQEQTKERTPSKGSVRKVCRDVVLLTDDRNLRVKALANDLPVRDVPDFLNWAGLSS